MLVEILLVGVGDSVEIGVRKGNILTPEQKKTNYKSLGKVGKGSAFLLFLPASVFAMCWC